MMKLMNLKLKDMKIHCVTKRQEINRVEAIDIFERNQKLSAVKIKERVLG